MFPKSNELGSNVDLCVPSVPGIIAPLGIEPKADAPEEVVVVWKRKGESTRGEGADLKGNSGFEEGWWLEERWEEKGEVEEKGEEGEREGS